MNPIINLTLLPSEIHEDRMIKYYVYPTDPGMIYWNYVKKRSDEESKVASKEKEENDSKDNLIDEEVFEDLGKVAITGVALFGLYELVKWGVAVALTPATGGGSLVAAGCMP